MSWLGSTNLPGTEPQLGSGKTKAWSHTHLLNPATGLSSSAKDPLSFKRQQSPRFGWSAKSRWCVSCVPCLFQRWPFSSLAAHAKLPLRFSCSFQSDIKSGITTLKPCHRFWLHQNLRVNDSSRIKWLSLAPFLCAPWVPLSCFYLAPISGLLPVSILHSTFREALEFTSLLYLSFWPQSLNSSWLIINTTYLRN